MTHGPKHARPHFHLARRASGRIEAHKELTDAQKDALFRRFSEQEAQRDGVSGQAGK